VLAYTLSTKQPPYITMSGSGCKAVCVLYTGSNNVIGHLQLTQSGDKTVIEGELTGLTPGKHGICVCVSGDTSKGPSGCGPVFNPFGMFMFV
jgi:Cu-Zn family superoxide dismutase